MTAPSSRRWRGRWVIGVALLSVALAGCSSEDAPRLGFPEPATEKGKVTLSLWQGSWLAAFIVGGLVWGLIATSVIMHRRRDGDPELPIQTRYNLPVEILYTLTPLITVVVLFYFTARDQTDLLDLDPNPDVKIQVVGQQWSWQFNYTDEDVHITGTPAEPPTLVVPQGELVQFTLTTADVVHDFWVPAFLLKMDIIPNDPNVLQMTPIKLGNFSGKCAELCGTYHSDMLFNVKVVTPDEYEDYITELRDTGQTGQILPELMDQDLGHADVEPGEGDLS